MGILKRIFNFLLIGSLLLLHSCFLIKIPVSVRHEPIKDTVSVYHFIVSSNKKIADSILTNSYVKESKKAYNWITKEAKLANNNLIFKEFWAANKNKIYKNTFIYNLPSKSLNGLRKKKFKLLIRKKTKKEDALFRRINWQQNLFDSLANWVNDTAISNAIKNNNNLNSNHTIKNQLFVIHFTKIKTGKILGFYTGYKAFIGLNTSRTIAHESIHYLGAPDIYIHKYWIGRRRRIVKRELKEEIMNNTVLENRSCETAYVSNYSAYCIGWIPKIDSVYKPLLKQNLMAKINFWLYLVLF